MPGARGYEVGTVARIDVDYGNQGFNDAVALRISDSVRTGWAADNGAFARDHEVKNVRPLVVLDLSDPADDVAHLRQCGCDNSSNCAAARKIAGQIEAQTRPPQMPQPTGLGAVVKDRWGHQFVRTSTDGGIWWNVTEDSFCGWDHIDAVEVLSEGVEL